MTDQPLHGITRREFLVTTGSVALGAALAHGADEGSEPKPKKTKVVLVRDADVIDENGKLNASVLERMLDQAVTTLFDSDEPASAWKQVVADAKKVGIKTNVWTMLRTPLELESFIKQRLVAAGVAEKNVPITDRDAIRILGDCDGLINARPLRTHHWAGIGGCIKNCIMFSTSPPSWHPDGCIDLGGLFNMPNLKGKCRLHILVVLTPLFHGKGPHHFDPRHVWDYKGLIVSTDPVAADATGVRLLVAKRREFFGKDIPFATHTRHVEVAETKHKVGVADPEKIELVKLGWKENILI